MGNAFILKPSEQTPISAVLLARALKEAGLPDGVFSVVNGGKEIVEGICTHEGIAAVGFVGSTRVAKSVYRLAKDSGKRVRALGGAKNHLIVLPDADPELTAENVVASATGAAGQRCMAASVLVAVGEVDHIIERIHEKMAALDPKTDIGSIISPEAHARISAYSARAAESDGAELLLDGREKATTDTSNGCYIGASIIEAQEPDHEACCDEIFGPTLTILRCNTLDEALAIENANPYGNAASIYTGSGLAAQQFAARASAGMVGVNVGVPVPREPFPFGGWNESAFGDGDITGKGAIDFWSKSKKITTKWTAQEGANWMS